MSEQTHDPKARLIELLQKVSIAMLSTRGPDGHFHSRPMATSDTEFDGNLYFLTDDRSGKVHDLEKDPETLVTYADDGKQIYISIRGRGELLHSKADIEKHWTVKAKGWFPKGSDDPDLCVLKVAIEDAEFWDAPNGKLVILYAYAKAAITGERAGKVGEHERVTLGGN